MRRHAAAPGHAVSGRSGAAVVVIASLAAACADPPRRPPTGAVEVLLVGLAR